MFQLAKAVILVTFLLVAQAVDLAAQPADDVEFEVSLALERLHHSDPRWRMRGAEQLMKLGPRAEAAIPRLIALLSDESGREPEPPVWSQPVARYASAALVAIGAKAIGPLAGALKENPDKRIRAEAARTLGSIKRKGDDGTDEMQEALASALDDRAAVVRAAAARALADFGPMARDSLTRLTTLLHEDDSVEVRRTAAFAFSEIDPAGADSIDPLITALKDKDAYVRSAAIQSLGSYGAAAKSAVDELTSFLEDRETLHFSAADVIESRPVAVDAAEALGSIGFDAGAAVPELEKIAKHDEDMQVRDAASQALRRIKNFLGIPDDQVRRVIDENPDAAYADFVTITKVLPVDYSDYLNMKKNERIEKEETRDDFIYFAVTQRVDIPIRAAAGNYLDCLFVTWRYRTPRREEE